MLNFTVILDIKHEQTGVKTFPKSIYLIQATHNIAHLLVLTQNHDIK
jgi:hypothetical protein